jgi:squalene-hopene/tetraprenyl-beta-curcumene cyclase
MKAVFTLLPNQCRSLLALVVALLLCPLALAEGAAPVWKPDAAGKYLDERQQVWSASARCISCHSGLPYALARPALRKQFGAAIAGDLETKLLAQVRTRVVNWTKLDTKAFPLYYDANDTLKKQSWGTEAVFNAIILASDDRYQGRTSPSAVTRQAFANLWQTQVRTGPQRGSWEWLDFNEAPWGNIEARYYGAALAAIAVGTVPGYYQLGADSEVDTPVKLLQGYLKTQLSKQNLHDQVWGLWAATQLEGILTKVEQRQLVQQLLDKQETDGGWSLTSLGSWKRHDGTAQAAGSDGYATALVLHVLQTAGLPKQEGKIAKGLVWLQRHQATSGAWPSASLVKKRSPTSNAGKFMSDAATAFAVLALNH